MAKVVAKTLVAELQGSTGRKVWGSSEYEKSGFIAQNRNGKIVIQKKTDRIQKSSIKQQKQREKFCAADLAYRKLTHEQKMLFRQYATELNRKYGKRYSCHTWWMKLALTNRLNEFFEKYLKLQFSEVIEEEKDYEMCYTVLIKKKDKEYIDETLLELLQIIRR